MSKSINLKATEQEDEEANDNDAEEEEEIFESEKKSLTVFADGGPKKERVLNKLIKYFGQLVVRVQPKGDGSDNLAGRYGCYQHQRAPNAALNVLRARVLLKDNEHYDTKDFTIFISKNKWVKNELRPLLELCSENQDALVADRDLAMRCIRLILVLIKDLREPTKKNLALELKLHKGKETKEEAEERYQAEKAKKTNADDQVYALLTFKEALSTEKCARAVTLVFADALQKERQSAEAKIELATTISYLRRMLAIDAAPSSPPGDIITAKSSHSRLIVSSKAMLAAIPSICMDIVDKHHDDWLPDIVLIIFYAMRGFEAKDFFEMWRDGALLSEEAMLDLNAAERASMAEPAPAIKALPAAQALPQQEGALPGCLSSARLLPGPSQGGVAAAPLRAGGEKKLSLKEQLEKEKKLRVATSVAFTGAMGMRHSRFSGNYRINLPAGSLLGAAPTAGSGAGAGANTTLAKQGLVAGVGGGVGAGGGAIAKGSGLPGQSTGATNLQPGRSSIGGGSAGAGVGAGGGAAAPTTFDAAKSQPIHSMVVRCPFAPVSSAPTVNRKGSKKNITFTRNNLYANIGPTVANEEDGRMACAVVASMATLIVQSGGLVQLVKRVNEDRRRDEGRISNEQELAFFQLLSRMLKFNRLKLEAQKQAFEEAKGSAQARDHAQASRASASARASANHYGSKFAGDHAHLSSISTSSASDQRGLQWVPELKNVIQALDKMSFGRVTQAMERLHDKEKRFDDVVYPMEVYKEMICYLRVLLESENSDHNEIAVALLHRVFYASSERLDPLPRLLSAWKPGIYDRRHLIGLVELVHETLRTLDSARACFDDRASDFDTKKRKGKSGQGTEMDLEQYIGGCLRFEVEEYFKRLVTHDSIDLYTRLLEKYASNESSTNKYVYHFFQRMWNFQLEQPYPMGAIGHHSAFPLGESTSEDAAEFGGGGGDSSLETALRSSDGPNLGYMLFNIRTFSVFNLLLNDPDGSKTKELDCMTRLVKTVVRRFGILASRNRMLFVEMLFQHPRPHNFVVDLDSVYDAPAFRFPARETSGKQGKHGRKSLSGAADAVHGEVAHTSSPRPEVEYGDEAEFDENDPAYQASVRAAEALAAAKGKTKLSRAADGGRSRPARAAKPQKLPRSHWTEVEDAVLRREYNKFKGTSEVFTLIAKELRDIGKKVSVDGVEKRVRQLKLYMAGDSDDDEEEEFTDSDEDRADNGSESDGQTPANDDAEEPGGDAAAMGPRSSKTISIRKSSRVASMPKPTKKAVGSDEDTDGSDNDDANSDDDLDEIFGKSRKSKNSKRARFGTRTTPSKAKAGPGVTRGVEDDQQQRQHAREGSAESPLGSTDREVDLEKSTSISGSGSGSSDRDRGRAAPALDSSLESSSASPSPFESRFTSLQSARAAAAADSFEDRLLSAWDSDPGEQESKQTKQQQKKRTVGDSSGDKGPKKLQKRPKVLGGAARVAASRPLQHREQQGAASDEDDDIFLSDGGGLGASQEVAANATAHSAKAAAMMMPKVYGRSRVLVDSDED